MRAVSLLCALLLGALTLVVGCGGGGGGGGGSAGQDYSFQVAWADRSRELQGPSAALSFRLVLAGAQANGQDYVVTGSRGSQVTAHTQTFSFRAGLRPIITSATATFYASATPGEGAIVGTAQAQADLRQPGPILTGTINTNSTIRTVTVPGGQRVGIGTRKSLVFEAKDADDNLVVVSPGSATWTSSDTGVLRFENGEAVGVAGGSANVRATVNGIQSAAVAVTVAEAPVVAVLRIRANQNLPVGVERPLEFTALDANGGDLTGAIFDETRWTSSNVNVLRFDGADAVGVADGAVMVTVAYTNPGGQVITSSPVQVTVGLASANSVTRLFAARPNTGPWSMSLTPPGGQEGTLVSGVQAGHFSAAVTLPFRRGEVRAYNNGTPFATGSLEFDDNAKSVVFATGAAGTGHLMKVAMPDGTLGANDVRIWFVTGTVASGGTFDVYLLRPGEAVANVAPSRTGVGQAQGFAVNMTGAPTSFAVTAPGSKTVLFQGNITTFARGDTVIVFDETAAQTYQFNFWAHGPMS